MRAASFFKLVNYRVYNFACSSSAYEICAASSSSGGPSTDPEACSSRGSSVAGLSSGRGAPVPTCALASSASAVSSASADPCVAASSVLTDWGVRCRDTAGGWAGAGAG